jgi:ribonuclease HI
MPGPKFYVVWKGLNPGIYDSWDACRMQVEGRHGAKYKSFASRSEALEALEKGYEAYLGKSPSPWRQAAAPALHGTGPGLPIMDSIAVDAACSGNPGNMEYRGVYTATGEEIFHIGPLNQGTNNVGEFLALVHGLALLKQKNSSLPVYSDSVNAIKWVREKKCKTLLKRSEINQPVFDLIDRALKWLEGNDWDTIILKWETSLWGEIPADFGRK